MGERAGGDKEHGMPKHVISVGFEIPGDACESVGFESDASLLDADIVVFSPNLEGYATDERGYQGKACLSKEDSGRALTNAAHWQKELQTALEAGRTVFVVLLGVGSLYVHTGQTNYSGTGRNARATNVVDIFEPYSFLPISGLAAAVHVATGERIKTTKDVGVLAAYWQEFGAATYYQAYIERNIGVVGLVTQTGDKMVGGIVRFKEWRGAVVLLPVPNFRYMVEERKEQQAARPANEESSGSKDRDGNGLDDEAEKSIGNQFVNALVEIDRVLVAKAAKTPPPAWANAEEYALKEEVSYRDQVSEVDARIAELQKRKLEAEGRLDAAGNLRGLMFETGKPLESAILEALQLTGFGAAGFSDSESEFDAVFTDPSGRRLLGEAEGKNDRAVNIDKLDQLDRNIQEEFSKREDSTEYAKGVLFGNAFRLLPPSERGDYFTPKCLSGAKRLGVALVRTPDLFVVAKFLKENSDPSFAASCRKAILETTGAVVEFLPIPEK
jgi:hypothetical protein